MVQKYFSPHIWLYYIFWAQFVIIVQYFNLFCNFDVYFNRDKICDQWSTYRSLFSSILDTWLYIHCDFWENIFKYRIQCRSYIGRFVIVDFLNIEKCRYNIIFHAQYEKKARWTSDDYWSNISYPQFFEPLWITSIYCFCFRKKSLHCQYFCTWFWFSK